MNLTLFTSAALVACTSGIAVTNSVPTASWTDGSPSNDATMAEITSQAAAADLLDAPTFAKVNTFVELFCDFDGETEKLCESFDFDTKLSKD